MNDAMDTTRPMHVVQPLHAGDAPPQLSLVVPMYNEQANLEPLVARLIPVLERCADSFEVIFVDDGSSDDTLGALRAVHRLDPRLRAISFSRNFGKEIAIAAGLDHARGDAVVIMDADLQHPPEMIETFVERWREGYQNVYGQRVDRTADSALRRLRCRLALATSACWIAAPPTPCAPWASARASPRGSMRGSASARWACRLKWPSAPMASPSSAIAS